MINVLLNKIVTFGVTCWDLVCPHFLFFSSLLISLLNYTARLEDFNRYYFSTSSPGTDWVKTPNLFPRGNFHFPGYMCYIMCYFPTLPDRQS